MTAYTDLASIFVIVFCSAYGPIPDHDQFKLQSLEGAVFSIFVSTHASHAGNTGFNPAKSVRDG